MGMLHMVEVGSACNGPKELPLFYMNDFSMIGLLVPSLPPAVQSLRDHGFQVDRSDPGVRVQFDGTRERERLFKTLVAGRIPFQVTDLMNHAYQG